MIGGLRQPLGPPPGPTRQLQDIATHRKSSKRLPDLVELAIPFRFHLGTPVIGATALPPLVIDGRSSPVARHLVSDQVFVLHERSFAAPLRTHDPVWIQADWGTSGTRSLCSTQILVDVLSGTAFVRQGVEERDFSEEDVDALIDVILTGLLT